MLQVTVVLLEMLRLEEHALRPNHLVVPGHSLSELWISRAWGGVRETGAALLLG
jgi:hypothetical protein